MCTKSFNSLKKKCTDIMLFKCEYDGNSCCVIRCFYW